VYVEDGHIDVGITPLLHTHAHSH